MSFTLHRGDCLDILPDIPDQSVDAVIADPPFGTTRNAWDNVIPQSKLWPHLRRIVKPHGAIVLFAVQPFAGFLVYTRSNEYKHFWIWRKNRPGNWPVAKYMPLTVSEEILIFTGKGERVNYYPIMRQGIMRNIGHKGGKAGRGFGGLKPITKRSDQRFPTNVLDFPTVERKYSLHPSEKPVPLLEYLIRTYTREGETVLDFSMGSGSAGEACINTGRRFHGIEKDPHYFDIARDRIEAHARAHAGEAPPEIELAEAVPAAEVPENQLALPI